MSRLIDAENIRIKPEFMHDVCGMAMIRVEDVVRILNEQPTIQPEPHWVPVTEKLPEKNGEYIVTIQCEHVDGWDDYVTGFAEWDVDDWHLVSYYPGQIKAVAWVPLPEPFKGGGDGMTEAIAFIAGLVAMAVVWFINDNSPNTSPYAHGYVEGYKDAMKKHKRREEEK